MKVNNNRLVTYPMDMESQIVVLGCLIQEFNVCAIVLQMLFVNFIKF